MPACEFDPTPPPLKTELEAFAQFLRAHDQKTRTWQLVLFPAVVAMGIIAISMFYLIHQMNLAMGDMTSYMASMRGSVEGMSGEMHQMNRTVADMTADVHRMSGAVDELDDQASGMHAEMGRINANLQWLGGSVGHITGSVGNLDRAIDRSTGPMQMLGAPMRMMGFGR